MRRLASFGNAMSFSVKLDPKYIIKQGYLTKSPPLHDRAIIKRRWRLRWFVLYDNGGEDVFLYYFDSELSVPNGRPKGKISLVGTEVYKQRGRLHGYSYVINIQTNERLYHLCSTQETVHEAWLDKIRDHYIPSAEVHQRRLTMLENQLMQPRPSLIGDTKVTFNRTPSVISNRSVTSNSDDEVDYREKAIMDDDDTTISKKHITLPRALHGVHQRPCPLPPGIPPALKESTSSDEEDASYVTMVGETNNSTKSHNVESEDEGIGRSDSDSSNASISRRPLSSPLTPTNYLPPFSTLRTAALRNSMDRLLDDGFVGPKILTPKENKKELPQRRSVGNLDLNHPHIPPRTYFSETKKPPNPEEDKRFSSYDTKEDSVLGDF